MCEEKTALACQDHDVKNSFGVFKISFEVKRTKLGNEELKVVTEYTPEIWVYPTFLQVFDCTRLVSIHSNHGFGNVRFVLAADVQPFLEPLHEGLLRDSLALLADEAAAECVVKAATRAEQTGHLNLFLLGHDVVQQLVPCCLVLFR